MGLCGIYNGSEDEIRQRKDGKRMQRRLGKTIAAIGLAGCMVLMAACSSNDKYEDYQEAYQAMSAPGSLDADITLDLVTDTETVKASGNMKMNQEGSMYYELKVGSTNVVQFVKDGTLYSDVDGVKATYDTKSKSGEKPRTESGEPMKEEGSGFNLSDFLEEFASMLEAGKIREMGLFDPIPKEVVKNVTVSESGDGKEYVLELPESAVEKLFNTMIEEQVSNEAYALQFDNLSDFNCTMHVNGSGVLDGMYYAGKTNVTVPAELAGGSEEKIPLDVVIRITLNNPGSSIEVPAPDTSGF